MVQSEEEIRRRRKQLIKDQEHYKEVHGEIDMYRQGRIDALHWALYG